MTLSEASNATSGKVPIQSTRLFTLFTSLTKIWSHFLNSEKSASDGVVSFFSKTIEAYGMQLRLSMLALILKNIVAPLYCSNISLWSSKNVQPSEVIVQLISMVLELCVQRLPAGENREFMKCLEFNIPGETLNQSFALGCDIVIENQTIACAQAVLQFLGLLIGYSYKPYSKSFALRQFSSNLASNLHNRRPNVNQINKYLNSGSPLIDASKLKDSEEVRMQCARFFRTPFEKVVVDNIKVGTAMCQLILLFLQTPCESIIKTTLNVCSLFVPYVGARTNYAAFLDEVFKINTQKYVSEEDDETINKRCLVINTYIFGFNVLKRNITEYPIKVKENVTSYIDQFLLSTELVTSDMYISFVNRMQSCKDREESVELLKDFYFEMQNSGEGNKKGMERLNQVIEIPKMNVKGKRGQKNKNKNNGYGNKRGYGNNKKNKNKKNRKYRQRGHHQNVFDDDEPQDLENDM